MKDIDQEIEAAAEAYEEQELFIPSPHQQDGFKESFTAGARWALEYARKNRKEIEQMCCCDKNYTCLPCKWNAR